MTFAEKLLKMRRRKGMSQEELAGRLDVSRQAVSRWENGSAMPEATKLFQISRIFGVTADYLLDDAAESPQENGMPETPQRKRCSGMIAGGIAACVGGIGLLAIGLFNSLYPARIEPTYEVGADGVETMVDQGCSGLRAFLWVHNLEWLFALCVVAVLAGVAIIIGTKIKIQQEHDRV